MGKKSKQAKNTAPAINPLVWAEEYLPRTEMNQLMDSLQVDVPISIRINRLKSQPDELVNRFSEIYGWEMVPVPYCESGYWIVDPETALSSTIEHRLGYFYIQEAASMLPAELFSFEGIDQPLVLDMAASPGGKTIHLIDRNGDKGLVIANDASRSRISALRIVLQNWGAINQAVTCLQGEWFGHGMPETFDAVLLDAPCSMQGLRTSASHKSRPITESEIDSLAVRQVNLLASALRTVKTGGEVVYSTCTLSPAENEGVLTQIKERFGDAVEVVDIQAQLSKPAPALGKINGVDLPAEVQRAARLWPHIFRTAGFFCAKLIKKQPITDDTDFQRGHRSIVNKGHMLPDGEAKRIIKMISAQYGFELEEVVRDQHLRIKEIKGNPFLVPAQLHALNKSLPILFQGMPLGKEMPKGWQPSHEFASRFGDRFTRQIFILDEAFHARWLRGEDIRGITDSTIGTGSIVLVRDDKGRNLGRGKVLKDRLKNRLPTRLF